MKSLKELYDGNLLSEVRVCQYNNERTFSRHKRAVVANTTTPATATTATPPATMIPDVLNDEDYAIVINISVWISVIMALAVLAGSYSLWFMDPGEDNIVYRMTMQRMKTD